MILNTFQNAFNGGGGAFLFGENLRPAKGGPKEHLDDDYVAELGEDESSELRVQWVDTRSGDWKWSAETQGFENEGKRIIQICLALAMVAFGRPPKTTDHDPIWAAFGRPPLMKVLKKDIIYKRYVLLRYASREQA